MEVSRRLRIAPDTVRTWRRRFIERAWTVCATTRGPASHGRSPMPTGARHRQDA
ncbi:hypothetical protein ACFY7H_29480 [Streptomyces sp. NPDC012794]|uniref:hypothetical protein n=1 Tax=Streptomyces sp. NPDC012794 TaxID=3364850 RepID=UPI0036A7EBC7